MLIKLNCPPLRLLAKVIATDADDKELFVVQNKFTSGSGSLRECSHLQSRPR